MRILMQKLDHNHNKNVGTNKSLNSSRKKFIFKQNQRAIKIELVFCYLIQFNRKQ